MTDTNEFTLLHVSPECGHLEATKILVEGDGAINNINKYVFTPLMLAAYNGRVEIFRYLNVITHNINIHYANKTTVLHLAISIREA